jgi:hypothetical protein
VTGHTRNDVVHEYCYQAYLVDKKTANNEGNGVLKETLAKETEDEAIDELLKLIKEQCTKKLVAGRNIYL